MPIPISIILTDRGAAGVPTTTNPINLAGRAESYEDTVDDRYGFSTARTAWTPTRSEILEWARADHLMRPMTAYSPDGRVIWDGFLAEIEISLGTKKIAFSLKDMANRLTVRYSTPTGGQGDSTTYSSAASQALFGIKDRVINASVAASAAATNQAQTILGVLAFPRSKQPSSAGTPRGDLQITLTFWGWYATLDWLLTSSASTTNTSTSTQIGTLLAAYAAVNNFISTSTAGITSTGVSDTEYTEPDTTYREKIERLLARGNSSQQPLAWGFYENRALTVATRASATPDTITYYESEQSGQIRDAYGNILDGWDVRPNAMALVTDLVDSVLVGASESPLRKYVSRVSRRISGNELSVSLEPEDTDSLEALLTSPAGGGPAGVSDRQAAFERLVITPVRSILPLDNDTLYDGSIGAWQPVVGGTGVPNVGTITVGSGGINLGSGSIGTSGGSITTGSGGINLGGGSITTGGGSISTGGGTVGNTGGGNVDLGTGVGIGGSGSTGVSISGSGSVGALTKWATVSSLANAVAGTDYAAASHTHATGDITSGTMATARLGSGTADTTTFLRGDSTWAVPTASAVGAAPDSATYIVQTASSGLSAEQALGALGTGLLKNTTTTGVLSIAVAADLPAHTHAAADIVSGTMATARLGSGTASSATWLRGDSSWAAPTAAAVAAAPDNATYIVQTASSGLSAEQALGVLATGILKNTTTTGVLSIAVAGTDYAAGSHTHPAADIVSGTMATARLGSGTANSSSFLRGDQTWQAITTITPSTIGAAPDSATYIVQTASSGLSNEQALGVLGTGLLKNTTTTGVLSIAAAGDLPSHTHAAADITSGTMATARLGSGTASASTLLWGDSTWAALVAGDLPSHNHAASDINSGTMATARLGSGTANSTTFLRGDQTWAAPPTSSVDGSGTAGYVAYWTDSNTLSGESNFFWDASNNRLGVNDSTPSYSIDVTGDIRATGDLRSGSELYTFAGVGYNFGGVSSSAVQQMSHVAAVQISGVNYYILLWDGFT